MLASLAGLAAYAFAQHRRVTTAWLYVPLAGFVWFALHNSGIHATLAGVALGLLTRVRPDRGEEFAPAARLEHRVQPFSAGFCVPVFALFAAGVAIDPALLESLPTNPIALAIAAGLLIGKPLGIFGTSWLAIKFGLATRPTGLKYPDLLALAVLGGIGFTVSLLIAELSLGGSRRFGARRREGRGVVVVPGRITARIGVTVTPRTHARSTPKRRDRRGRRVSIPSSNGGGSRGRHEADVPGTVASIPLSDVDVQMPGTSSIGNLVKDATTQVSTLVRAEVELAKAEVTGEVKKGLQGSLFFILALTVLLFSAFFFFFFVAELLDIWLPRWLAFLIVFLLMLVVAAVLGLIGYLRVRKLRAPEKTIDSLKQARTVLPSSSREPRYGRRAARSAADQVYCGDSRSGDSGSFFGPARRAVDAP